MCDFSCFFHYLPCRAPPALCVTFLVFSFYMFFITSPLRSLLALCVTFLVLFYIFFITSLLRSLPALVWHRQNWDVAFPVVEMDDPEAEVLTESSSYVAGVTDAAIEGRYVGKRATHCGVMLIWKEGGINPPLTNDASTEVNIDTCILAPNC